jgi:hypothetical protein
MISKFQLRRVSIGALKCNIAALVPRLFFLITSLIGSQVLMVGTASSDTLGGTVQASVSEGNATLDSNTAGSNTASGQAVSVPQAGYSGPPVGTANATSTIGFIGSPFASVTAGGSVLLDGSGTTINAGGTAVLTYTFSVQGPTGPANSVPVGFDILISTSINGEASANASIDVGGADAGFNLARVNGNGFLGEIVLNLTPGNTYQVNLSAGAGAFGQAGASALVDPHIFIDSPALALLYSIVLPDGVGNDLPPGFGGSPVATPLPAALPLFASGLGALGLLGWRRKRKNAAAIAA